MNDVRESRSTSEIKKPSLQTMGEPKLFRVRGMRKTLAALVAAIVIATTVAATVNLFTHSLPPVSAGIISTPCGPNLTPLNLPPASGTGNVLFGCAGTSGASTPAVVVSAPGTVYEWVSNASAPIRLTLVVTDTVPCTGGLWVLEPTVTFTSAGNYWYCLQNVSSPTPRVDVHWYAQQ